MNDPVLVIAGGSGFLGHTIIKKYRDTNVRIVVLSRKEVSATPGAGPRYENVSYVHWDAATPGDWMAALEGSTAVINLVGRSVNCRYTERNKNEIIASRVNATRILGYAIKVIARPPKVWINIGSAATADLARMYSSPHRPIHTLPNMTPSPGHFYYHQTHDSP